MRAALHASMLVAGLALASVVGLLGCGSSAKKAEVEAAQARATANHQNEFQARCGDPVRFPISDECIRMAGDRGPMLRRQSDLTLAVWRACSLIPSSAEAIGQELVAKGTARTAVGQKMIGEMERTEQHSDSPCVAADLRDLDCVAGNSEACGNAREADPSCVAWSNDADTQSRLRCIERAVHDPACTAKPSEEGAASYFSDSPAQAEDCRRIENACLHSFEECANAKDALAGFLKPPKPAGPAQ